MAGSCGDRNADEGRVGPPDPTTNRSPAGPAAAEGGSTGASTTAGAGATVAPPPGTSFGARARAVAIAVLIGVPAFAFLAVITWGAILTPLAGLLLLAPFVAVNYLLWGRFVA